MATNEKEARKAMFGWFENTHRRGDRTLEQQIVGLEPLWDAVDGRTVLDVGCAEGLISFRCAENGAQFVKGVEIVDSHVALARRLRQALPCVFVHADANAWEPDRLYDVVLLLAILHKLKNPTEACVRFASAAKGLCVIRFPSASEGPVIIDERSGNEPHDIGEAMEMLGFDLDRVTSGPFEEQTYFYRR